MQLDRRINLGLASYARVAHACMRACVYAHARTLVQPECLQNTWIRYHRRVTHARARARTRVHQSSFTPICLRSPETIQTRVLPSTRYVVLEYAFMRVRIRCRKITQFVENNSVRLRKFHF